MKRILGINMLIMIVCCMVLSNNTLTFADTNPNRKNISMYINMEKQLKVADVSEKVAWTSTNNKVVSVIGTKGKNNSKAIILSKKKKGTCTIKATVGNKTYEWNVTVKGDKKLSRVKLKSVKISDKKVKVNLQYINNTGNYMEYGREYSVQRMEDGKWVTVIADNPESIDSVQLELRPESKITLSFIIAKGKCVKEFTKGVYRIKGDASFIADKYSYVYFIVR